MQRFRDIPIKRKLTLVILLTCTGVLLLAGAGMVATAFVTTRRAMVEDVTVLADVLGQNSTAALSFHREEDVEEVNKTLSALDADPHIVIATVYDKRSNPFGRYLRKGAADDAPAQPPPDGWRFTNGHLEVSRVIEMDGKRVGAIFLRSDLGRLYGKLRLYAVVVVLILAAIIVMTIGLAPRLQKPITDPILALAGVARHVAERKEYSARAVKQSEDEVGELTDALNQMLSEIEAAHASLLSSNESMQKEIAERNRAEAARRTSDAQLQTIVENLDEGVVVSDLNGQLLHFNRAALELHGYASMDECRRHLTEFVDTFVLSGMDGAVWAVDQWPLARILRGEKLHDLEVRIRRIGANWQRVFSYGGTLVNDADGKPLMAVVTVSDITERKRAESVIRQLNAGLEQRVAERTAQLQTANNELEAFSYSVSHDLRAPLRSLDGFSQALVEDCADKLDAEALGYLHRIRKASQRMGQLIDDLLNLSRLSRTEMKSREVDLSKLAHEVADELRTADPQREAEFVIAEGLVAQADPQLLRVAFTNLFANAWKFTGKRPDARIEFGCAGENGNKAFFVRDNGVGFDMAYAGKLFGAFQRLHAMQEFPGTGIGLATVQRVIHRHGGRIWAESALNAGATFHFTL